MNTNINNQEAVISPPGASNLKPINQQFQQQPLLNQQQQFQQPLPNQQQFQQQPLLNQQQQFQQPLLNQQSSFSGNDYQQQIQQQTLLNQQQQSLPLQQPLLNQQSISQQAPSEFVQQPLLHQQQQQLLNQQQQPLLNQPLLSQQQISSDTFQKDLSLTNNTTQQAPLLSNRPLTTQVQYSQPQTVVSQSITQQPDQQVTHVNDAPITQVIQQPMIERHLQPRVTEVVEQDVYVQVEEPIVRKFYEPTIVRNYQPDSGRFDTFHAPMKSKPIEYEKKIDRTLDQQTDRLKQTHISEQKSFETKSSVPLTTRTDDANTITSKGLNAKDTITFVSCSGKNEIWGVSSGHELYKLVNNNGTKEWEYVPTGVLISDISSAPGGYVFAIGFTDKTVYRYNPSTSEMESLISGDAIKLKQISAQTKSKVYAVTQDGKVMYLSLGGLLSGKPEWQSIGGNMKWISVGGKHLFRRTELWGIDFMDRAARFVGDKWMTFDIKLKDIAVSDDNAVYGVREDGKLVKWDGDQKFLLQGNLDDPKFKYAELERVTAYKEGKHVYAVEKGTGNILRMV